MLNTNVSNSYLLEAAVGKDYTLVFGKLRKLHEEKYIFLFAIKAKTKPINQSDKCYTYIECFAFRVNSFPTCSDRLQQRYCSKFEMENRKSVLPRLQAIQLLKSANQRAHSIREMIEQTSTSSLHVQINVV
jgi:hypothetical protein